MIVVVVAVVVVVNRVTTTETTKIILLDNTRHTIEFEGLHAGKCLAFIRSPALEDLAAVPI
jgi:hypothetical protein